MTRPEVCRHGFDAQQMHGIGWSGGCPSCEWEARLPPPVRFIATHPHWGPWITAFSLVLSLIALILSLGVVERWWVW
jgi:hypothetical protein